MKLSLAVAAKGICDPEMFIKALVQQGITHAPDIDVHIAHDMPLPAAAMAGNIIWHACGEGTSILRLWGKAIACSTGDSVAALDIRCPPAPGWLHRVETELEQGTPLFFGPVDPGWDKGDSRIVGYITEYAQFHAPLAVELEEVPGNNIVCRRELLDNPQRLEEDGFLKTFMVWRLEREQGLSPQRFDDMAVIYRKPFGAWHYMKRRYAHGRCFAASRHDNPGQPPRLLCLLFTPALPLLRTWRIFRVVKRHQDLSSAFLRHLHLVLCSEISWSAGEFGGYAFGGRQYCEQLD